MSKVPEIFVPKAVKAWADYSDDEEKPRDVVPQDLLPRNLESLAQVICAAMGRIELNDVRTTAVHFEIGEYYVDMMLRGTLNICVSLKRTPMNEDNASSTSSPSTVASPPSPREPTSPVAAVSTEEKDEWQEVTHKKRRPGSVQTFLCFRDTCNDPHFGDLIGVVHSFKEADALMKKETWGHVYHQEKNLVYDYPHPDRRGLYRSFSPNKIYLEKLHHWQAFPEPDQHEWYVFGEGIEHAWEDRFLGKIKGLNEVRKLLKPLLLKGDSWAHAYAPLKASDEVVLFHVKNHLFQHRVITVSTEYLDRFALFRQGLEHPDK